jgi:hypothetical protein
LQVEAQSPEHVVLQAAEQACLHAVVHSLQVGTVEVPLQVLEQFDEHPLPQEPVQVVLHVVLQLPLQEAEQPPEQFDPQVLLQVPVQVVLQLPEHVPLQPFPQFEDAVLVHVLPHVDDAVPVQDVEQFPSQLP